MNKKTRNIWLTILEGVLALLLTFGALIGVACDSETPWNKVLQDEISLTITDGVLVEYTDSHGGFLGDGLTYICVDVSASNLSVEGTHGWVELPMTENIHTVLYGSETHGALKESFEFTLPDAQDGYYYFYNKQSDSYTDEGLLGQPSYNFKFALYDTDKMKFYYIELDT